MKEQPVIEAQGIDSPKRNVKEPLKKRLLTVKETAIYLGRSVPSIRELIWAGKLTIVREGRRMHCDIYDLDKWIEKHKTQYTY